MNAKKFLTWTIRIALTLVVLYFLFRQVEKHWLSIADFDWHLNIWFLLLSLACGELALALFAPMWRNHIDSFGYSVTHKEAYKVLYLSNLGRYVPGKIWQVLGILYLTRRKGIATEAAGASFVILQMFTIPASLLVFAVASVLEPRVYFHQIDIFGPGTGYVVLALIVAVSATLIVFPGPVLRLGNFVLRKLRRPEVTFRLDKTVALKLFVGYFFIWVVYGLAFWLLLLAVAGNSQPSAIAAIGVYCAAYQVGYLLLFAPGGFGPRELVLGTLLMPFIGPIAPAVAIIARLWSILIETIAALIAVKIKM